MDQREHAFGQKRQFLDKHEHALVKKLNPYIPEYSRFICQPKQKEKEKQKRQKLTVLDIQNRAIYQNQTKYTER